MQEEGRRLPCCATFVTVHGYKNNGFSVAARLKNHYSSCSPSPHPSPSGRGCLAQNLRNVVAPSPCGRGMGGVRHAHCPCGSRLPLPAGEGWVGYVMLVLPADRARLSLRERGGVRGKVNIIEGLSQRTTYLGQHCKKCCFFTPFCIFDPVNGYLLFDRYDSL